MYSAIFICLCLPVAALRSEYTVHGTVIVLNYTSIFAHTHLSFSLLQTQVNILWLIMKFG